MKGNKPIKYKDADFIPPAKDFLQELSFYLTMDSEGLFLRRAKPIKSSSRDDND